MLRTFMEDEVKCRVPALLNVVTLARTQQVPVYVVGDNLLTPKLRQLTFH